MVFSGTKRKSAIILTHAVTGDATLIYQPLIAYLKHLDVPIYCIDANELDFSNTHDLQECTKRYTTALIRHVKKQSVTNINYYLIGWSSGGAIAWKIAEHLEAEGEKVKFLALVDSLAPSVYTSLDQVSYATEIHELVERIIVIANAKFNISFLLNISVKILSSLEPYAQIDYIFSVLLKQTINNRDASIWLQNIQWLIKAIQTAHFKQCSIKPTLFRSKYTTDKLKEYGLDAEDRQIM